MDRYIIINKLAGDEIEETSATQKKDAFKAVCGLTNRGSWGDACIFDRLTGKRDFFRVSKNIGVTRGHYDSEFESMANERINNHIRRLKQQDILNYIERELETINEIREEMESCDDDDEKYIKLCNAERMHKDIIDDVIADAVMSGMNLDVVIRGVHINI